MKCLQSFRQRRARLRLTRPRNVIRDVAFIGMASGLVLAVTYLSGSAFSLKFNLGDAIIVCLAVILPLRRVLPAAIIGSVLADLFLGGFNYAPFTLGIKGLLAILASSKWGASWPVLGISVGEVCVVLGYFGADLVYYDLSVAIADLYWNLAQALAAIAIGFAFFFATVRMRPRLVWATAVN